MAIKLSTSYTRQPGLTHLLFSQSHLIGSVRVRASSLATNSLLLLLNAPPLSLSNNSAGSN